MPKILRPYKTYIGDKFIFCLAAYTVAVLLFILGVTVAMDHVTTQTRNLEAQVIHHD